MAPTHIVFRFHASKGSFSFVCIDGGAGDMNGPCNSRKTNGAKQFHSVGKVSSKHNVGSGAAGSRFGQDVLGDASERPMKSPIEASSWEESFGESVSGVLDHIKDPRLFHIIGAF